jgi:hypothetical protein
MPDMDFKQEHPDWNKYEEDPTLAYANPDEEIQDIFKDTLVLRLRFAGWGLVQLATDPDPPTDEVGCTGTQMLHAADGNKRFDRALVWQNKDSDSDRNIVRGPEGVMPKIGVSGLEVTLMVTAKDGAKAGPTPLQIMNSTGAVQTSGVQQDLLIDGLLPLASYSPEKLLGKGSVLGVDLREKNGVRPYLYGDNHLVWQDGEPIDPFVLAVTVNSPNVAGNRDATVFQREVYTGKTVEAEKTMVEMSPIERIGTCRGPLGFDKVEHIPEWALAGMGKKQRDMLEHPGFPDSLLADRSRDLAMELERALAMGKQTQAEVDTIASLADRMWRFSVPRSTTKRWATYSLHYGHSVSGPMKEPEAENPVFAAIRERLRVSLTTTRGSDRTKANSRWLVGYTTGYMDTDALADFVYGELYIPVSVQSSGTITLSQSWAFPAEMKDALAQFACRFENPFWDDSATVKDGQRILKAESLTITETLLGTPAPYEYAYDATFSGEGGVEQVREYRGSFSVDEKGETPKPVRLCWEVSFQGTQASALVIIMRSFAETTAAITRALTQQFGPVSSAPAS